MLLEGCVHKQGDPGSARWAVQLQCTDKGHLNLAFIYMALPGVTELLIQYSVYLCVGHLKHITHWYFLFSDEIF